MADFYVGSLDDPPLQRVDVGIKTQIPHLQVGPDLRKEAYQLQCSVSDWIYFKIWTTRSANNNMLLSLKVERSSIFVDAGVVDRHGCVSRFGHVWSSFFWYLPLTVPGVIMLHRDWLWYEWPGTLTNSEYNTGITYKNKLCVFQSV